MQWTEPGSSGSEDGTRKQSLQMIQKHVWERSQRAVLMNPRRARVLELVTHMQVLEPALRRAVQVLSTLGAHWSVGSTGTRNIAGLSLQVATRVCLFVCLERGFSSPVRDAVVVGDALVHADLSRRLESQQQQGDEKNSASSAVKSEAAGLQPGGVFFF